MSLSRNDTVENCTIKKVLGVGGFGVTYLAYDSSLGVDVALKESFPQWLVQRDPDGYVRVTGDATEFEWATRHFIDEARYLVDLNHPNIVQVDRAFEYNGTAYFVMEYLHPASSLSKMKGVDQWPEQKLTSLLRQLLDALSYLHNRNIYHRDIKPDNIMWLERKKQPVLIDFGAAKCRISDDPNTRGFVSMGYTAPEQLQDPQYLAPSVDIYSLGATLHYLLTGQPPAPATKRIFKDTYHPLAGNNKLASRYSPALLHSIDKALRMEPNERHSSARAWLDALSAPPEYYPTNNNNDAARRRQEQPSYPPRNNDAARRRQEQQPSYPPRNNDAARRKQETPPPPVHRDKPKQKPTGKPVKRKTDTTDKQTSRRQGTKEDGFNWLPITKVCLWLGIIILAIIAISLFGPTTGDHSSDLLLPAGLTLFLIGLAGALWQSRNNP